MNSQEEIQQLQKELKRLQHQLNEQQRLVTSLYNRLEKLGGVKKEVQQSLPGRKERSLENFIGLRLIHLIGMVVLVTGLSIGVKYAIDRNLISEVMRIALAYAAGIVLYIFSIRLKDNYRLFSAVLFSGSMASLYFTTYGAYVYYEMMPFALAFVLMIGLTVFTVYQALAYNRQEIALLGLVGAYAVPFLISRNSERADLFFLYITIINLGVVYLGVRKPWKNMGRVAQLVTWVLFIGWAAVRFDIRLQWIGFVFMSSFFLLFWINAVSDRIFHRQSLKAPNVYQLTINNLALYLSSLFVIGSSFQQSSLAMVTIGVAMIVALEAILLHYIWQESAATGTTSLFSFLLFIIFIAFQWKGLTVTLLWLLVAVIVFTLGALKKRAVLRMTSIVLMGVTLLKLIALDSLTFSTVQKVVAFIILGVLLLVVSYFYQKYKQQLFNNTEA